MDVAGGYSKHSVFLILGAAGLGCSAPNNAALPIFLPETPHERYEFAFRQVGLETTALGYEWISASRVALDEALTIQPPHSESGYFDPNQAPSLGYRIVLQRGQRLLVNVELNGLNRLVFIDLYRIRDGDAAQPFAHEVSADSNSTSLDYIARRDGEYILRLQPELLTGGRYDITVLQAASLGFPVDGHNTESIRSGFGADRDGGRRRHEGVDIFARRGTPVVASMDGRVSSTRRNNLGGNVVWLRTELGSLYHAHLDRVVVRRDSMIQAGDTLGFVGNSGNARTTPPHLHFGIYARRPTDPYPFLFQPSQDPPMLTADVNMIGSNVRATRGSMSVRASPRSRGDVVRDVFSDTPMLVLGGAGSWYRVRLPDNSTGFVLASSVESTDDPVDQQVVAWTVPVYDAPNDVAAAVMDSVISGGAVSVLGRFDGYLMVQGSNGRPGWVAESSLVLDDNDGA